MIAGPPWHTFPSLSSLPGFAHAFTLRHPEIDVRVDRDEAVRRLWEWHWEIVSELGFDHSQLVTANQVHGADVAVIRDASRIPTVDGLITAERGLALGIYVADCCAIYLADPVSGAYGLLHSGKKGSELGIITVAIRRMQREFGTRPEDLIVQLSPCVRPPVYEVDFASTIREHAAAAGVPMNQIHDDGACTASEPQKYYSYRREKGRTGRMLAILGRR
jgi:polyphenol oxidase